MTPMQITVPPRKRLNSAYPKLPKDYSSNDEGLTPHAGHGDSPLMAIDPVQVTAAFRKLEKSMCGLPSHPSPEQVHKLRTRIRKIEATLQALLPENSSRKKDLQKRLKPVRKRAGDVRDMDVLIGLVTDLKTKSENDDRVRLIEQLSRERIRAAQRLHKSLSHENEATLRKLRKCSTHLKREFSQSPRELSSAALTTTYAIWTELLDWPPLSEENLHPFRLKVKPLRSILQLAEDPDAKLVDALGAVKDAIGEWHDWNELLSIAEDILRQESTSPLLREIRIATRVKLQHALTLARNLRKNHLPPKTRQHPVQPVVPTRQGS